MQNLTCKTGSGSRTLERTHSPLPAFGAGGVPGDKQVEISVRKRGQVGLIQLKGALRLGQGVDDLRRTIEESLSAGDSRLVLNMAEVPVVDSSGIGLMVRFLASAKQHGGNLKLANPSKFTVQTLRLVGVLNLFDVFESDDAAIESFR